MTGLGRRATERDRDVTEDDDQRPMLPLAEAAERMGRHPEALRSLIRRGKLAARKANAGGWLVAVDDREPTGALAADDRGLADALAELKEEVAELRDRATRAEVDADRAREVAEVKVAAAERIIDELRAEVAHHRRPWWRKLLG